MQQRQLEYLFWNARNTQQAIMRFGVYALALGAVGFLAFINIMYGVTFTRAQNEQWIRSIAVGLLTGTSSVNVMCWSTTGSHVGFASLRYTTVCIQYR